MGGPQWWSEGVEIVPILRFCWFRASGMGALRRGTTAQEVTLSTIPTPVPVTTDEPVAEIDLTDLDAFVESRHARRFDEAHILEWLRTSGGTLAERIMKSAAADLIERQREGGA